MNILATLVTTSLILMGLPVGVVAVPNEIYLVDFSKAEAFQGWRVVNDGVMGGLSQSRIQATSSDTAVFEGQLSLENNGGFASVRTLLNDLDLSGREGIIIRARGDGRKYQIRLRTDQRFDGVTYRATFTTKPDQWTLEKIPFSKFEPTFRGRILTGVAPLDPARIQQLAFMVADKKEGSFRLEIEWVKAFAK